jgi:hypothetical protein
MVDFKKLKANSGKTLETLTKEVEKLNSNGFQKDTRYWYPEVDKTGNGYAVIRFLPAPGEEVSPFVRLWNHSFKGPTGQWYIENSLTTLNNAADPVGEYNSILWNQSTDDKSPGRTQARAQKRNLHYISNVLVINDLAHPENNGKVFLYMYGKKIFDKINDALVPKFPGEVAFDPFDFWTGANFEIKIRTVDKQRNYDSSLFMKPSALFEKDAQIEAIWKQEYSLLAEVAPDKFKTYDELKKRLDLVLGLSGIAKAQAARANVAKQAEADEKDDDKITDLPWQDSGDSEDINFFKNLAN